MTELLRWSSGRFLVVIQETGVEGRVFGVLEGPEDFVLDEEVASAAARRIGVVVGSFFDEQLFDTAEDLARFAEFEARAEQEAGPTLASLGVEGHVVIERIQLEDGREIRRSPSSPRRGQPAAGPLPQASSAPLPSAPRPVAGVPELTVEHYAAFCVERTLYPHALEAVAQRYGVASYDALQALDARWHGRFGGEPHLYVAWQQAYAEYEGWLRQQAR
ncbi:MAG: hypothetical protein FJ096_01280 [Deltaproteobacteria bacterium]|nr:hypothetical protein [Deltaproteobacteria bacterium]